MRATGWWRRRDAQPDQPSAPTGAAAATSADASHTTTPLLDRNLDMDGSDPDRAAEYSAWADRLREKRERAKRTISGEQQQAATYWSADTVFQESQRVADAELASRPDPLVLTGKLGVLGLDASASQDDIERAYRRLAKVHHPDFHHDADEATKTYHAEQMRQINEAYTALRNLA